MRSQRSYMLHYPNFGSSSSHRPARTARNLSNSAKTLSHKAMVSVKQMTLSISCRDLCLSHRRSLYIRNGHYSRDYQLGWRCTVYIVSRSHRNPFCPIYNDNDAIRYSSMFI
ncbi:uncharacterized protein C8R40DRAFT_58444 [Lentinula edodes]|uniref:uncharacterized protein n=1 Tax=Lentinula edodes TaxID=5353 RepID=UPI001E8CC689|nr:uncharacterized protein C8R40DRAFT_58444 [Lentinula edodes]KAH7881645.1 hypothetical protein C8R40DRAFT_58444 [Lentinula edodes]